MANNCYNWASLHGTPESLNLLESRIKEITDAKEHLWYQTFHKVLGIEHVEGDVYELYGSKWFDIEYERTDDNMASISGDSAWSPVNEFFRKLSEVYNLEISSEYEEPGCDFGGFFECENGEVIKDECFNYRLFKIKSDQYDSLYDDINDSIESDCYPTYEDLCSDLKADGVLEHMRAEDMESFKKLINKINQDQ